MTRMLPRGTWVVHTHGDLWQAMELGTVVRYSSGVKGGRYVHIPPELPGIFLGPLIDRHPRGRRKNNLVRVLWMGCVFLCNLDDVRRL